MERKGKGQVRQPAYVQYHHAQKLALVDGMLRHKERDEDPLDVQYGPSHTVTVEKGGFIEGLTGKRELTVNSLHGQGVRELAPRGLIEAYRVTEATSFALAVQWHPEWMVMDNPDSVALFEAFAEACRERRSQRIRSGEL